MNHFRLLKILKINLFIIILNLKSFNLINKKVKKHFDNKKNYIFIFSVKIKSFFKCQILKFILEIKT